MANDPNPLEGCMDHRRGQSQPTEQKSSSSDLPTARPLGVDHEALSEARNAPIGTSRPAEPSRGSRTKARAYRGCARGRDAREESGDVVQEGEDVA